MNLLYTSRSSHSNFCQDVLCIQLSLSIALINPPDHFSPNMTDLCIFLTSILGLEEPFQMFNLTLKLVKQQNSDK